MSPTLPDRSNEVVVVPFVDPLGGYSSTFIQRGGRYITARPNIGSARCLGAPDRHISGPRGGLVVGVWCSHAPFFLLSKGLR